MARKSIDSRRVVAELIERVSRFSHEEAFLKGLNPAQWRALRYFARANKASRTVSSFALFHGTTRGTASQTVKALVGKSCLRRRQVKEDRRSFRLELTAKGRRMLARDPFQALMAAAGALPSSHRSRIAKGLEIMIERLLVKRGRPLFGVCGSCGHLRDTGAGGGLGCEHGTGGESLAAENLAEICVNYEPT